MTAAPQLMPQRRTRAPAAPALADHGIRVHPLVRVACYLFVLSIPFEIPNRTIPLEVPTLMGFVFLAATLLHPSACYRRIPAPVVLFGVYLWATVVAAYANRVAHPILAVRFFINLTQLVLLFWVMYNMFADRRVLRGVLLALAVACTVRAGMQVLGVAASAHEQWTGGARVTVLGQNTNLSAIILSAGLVAVVGLRLSASRGAPHLGLLTWPIAAMLGLAIVQTGSRGGLLCAAVGLIVFMLHGRGGGARLRNGFLAIFGLGLLAWTASRTEVMRNRFEQASEEGQLAGRERIYPATLEMFRERPLLGWAPIDNQFEIARRIADYEDPQRDAHNLVLELLTATGLLGTIPFLAGLALCVRAAWRARTGPLGVLPLALTLAVLTGTVSGTWIAGKIVWLALAVAAGAAWLPTASDEGKAPCAV